MLRTCLAALVSLSARGAGLDVDGSNQSMGPGQNASSEKVWHMLSPELQHSLSGILTRHGDMKQLDDPDVGAFLSNLLHDELVTQQENAHDTNNSDVLEAAQLAKSQQEHEQHLRELEASRKVHLAEREAAKAHREAQRQQALKETEERQRAHDELVRKNEEFMQKSKARHEKAEAQRAAMQERHAKTWERASSLLRQVHEDLEVATNGWRDAPFWDDFFHSSSAAVRFSQLNFDHIEPALRSSSLMPHHRVLVLEPRGASLAEQLATAIRTQRANHVEAYPYGAESDDSRDLVLEVGLLDAMAMAQASDAEASKLDALRSAANRLATLVKPGGTWISVSAVPPTLRLPLLGRLASSAFALPSADVNGSAGTHSIILPATTTNGKASAGLRGAAQVADMLLYGSEDVHFWAYRMRRDTDMANSKQEEEQSAPDGLLDIIRQQRPGTRDDL